MHQPLLYNQREWQNIEISDTINNNYKVDKECCLVCGLIIIFNILFTVVMLALIQTEDVSLNM